MDEEPEAGVKLGVFSTGPSIDVPVWNVVTEIIATALLLIGVLAISYGEVGIQPGNGAFFIELLIVIIGMATGGATGYALNPARDLGPRIAHAILPIKGKGGSNWKYSWVPVVGPIIGAPRYMLCPEVQTIARPDSHMSRCHWLQVSHLLLLLLQQPR